MPTSLPQKFHSFFWDINPQKLNFQKNDVYIIERFLEWGDLDALEWIKNNYGKEKIIATLKNSRNLSNKTANFYSQLFNIPRKDLRCFQTHSLQILPWLFRS